MTARKPPSRSPVSKGAAPGPAPLTASPARRAARTPPKRVPSVHAVEREEEILNAAAEIFYQRGYGATSMQDIANAVGMLKGSLYYYFKSKEDLLYTISRAIHENAMANMAAADAIEGSAEDKLRSLMLGHMRALPNRRRWISVFYTEYRHLTGNRRTEIGAVRRRYEGFVQDLIKQGQAVHSFCPERDPAVMTTAVLTILNGSTLWSPNIDIESMSAEYAEFAMSGLRCKHRHGPAPVAAKRSRSR